MSAIINRLKPSSQSATSSASAASETDAQEQARSRSSATRGSRAIPAYTYAEVQNQVWNWKPNDSGLDMP